MSLAYPTLKMLHVLGAIVFVGNIMVTALWKVMADRSREPRVVAFGQRLVSLADAVFTAPGAVLVLVTCVLMAPTYGGEFWRVPWLAWGLALFGASAVIWAAVLIPIQVNQSRLARAFSDGTIPDEYWRLGRRWMMWGALATLLPLVNVYFMVFKPS
jgi:uncharacterized membrane protein